jgi:hypothetical protein
MMIKVNEGLTKTDFKAGPGRFKWAMRPGDLNGFLGVPNVVTLPRGFKLFKLTGDKALDGNFGITPWWSPVSTFLEDHEGAKGRYEQAQLNGIDMSSMARYMSAVVINWNDLSEYVEVEINPEVEISCFWGKFAPMQLSQATGAKESSANLKLITERSKTTSVGYSNAILPSDIGVLEAWQLYIPGLKNEHLAQGAGRLTIDAHDMQKLGRHLGVRPVAPSIRRTARMPSLVEFYKATSFSQVQARNPTLKEMDECLRKIESVAPPPAPLTPRSPAIIQLLSQFVLAGNKYRMLATDPRKSKEKVEEYVNLAKSWLK